MENKERNSFVDLIEKTVFINFIIIIIIITIRRTFINIDFISIITNQLLFKKGGDRWHYYLFSIIIIATINVSIAAIIKFTQN